MVVAVSTPRKSAFRNVRDALLHKLKSDDGLFALGAAVARVVQLASSDDEAPQELAHYVLSDVALTQKILRLANTVAYRRVANAPVTTISRAIFLLGFDTVKTCALALLLVDSLASDRQATRVRTELVLALRASLVGRELARRSAHPTAEEASIAALFKNLGRLLVASHAHRALDDIDALVAAGEHNAAQASAEILGCSFETLAAAVLAEWNIPPAIVQALPALPKGVQKPAANRQEWLRQAASFSAAAARLLGRGRAGLEAGSEKLLERYGAALNLDADKLRDIYAAVNKEMRELAAGLQLGEGGADDGAAQAANGLPDVLQAAALVAEPPTDARHPSGKPVNARELLLSGVQDVMQMRMSNKCRVNELILAVLEALYRSMGFRFATVCLKDATTGQFRARAALGEYHVARQAHFRFPIASQRDLFHLAMENDADLMIADARSEKIQELLPQWHRDLLPDARSFIVLPLVVKQVRVGLFYADRAVTAGEGVPPDETALIKALKSQILAAIEGN